LIFIRCDCYRFDKDFLRLPKKICVRWRGAPTWRKWTRQGRLVIAYDEIKRKWYAHQPVEVPPLHQPLSKKRAYVDLGVLNLLTVCVEGEQQTLAYIGRPALTGWWYLSRKIDKLKSVATSTNGTRTTKLIRQLFRRRRLRFHQYVNTIVRRAIHNLWLRGVSVIVVGDLTGILANINGTRKCNFMTHNFWSHKYLNHRLQDIAAEYGVKVEMVNEQGTSSTCPRCESRRNTRRGRCFKCRKCGLEAHRDGIGCVNIGRAQGAVFPEGVINGVVARPLEVKL
jgi:putative transposase